MDDDDGRSCRKAPAARQRRPPCPSNRIGSLQAALSWLALALVAANGRPAMGQLSQPKPNEQRDLRWPAKQVNVLVDPKSFNQTELDTLGRALQQLEHRTCLKVKRLDARRVNPFNAPARIASDAADQPADAERNFLYVFKSLVGAPFNRHPALGLSSLGCMQQGRQSVVLTELAFRFPELVLRYHLMRSLGVDSVERPDGQVRRLLNMLPLSQKIGSGEPPLESSADDNQRLTATVEPYNPTLFAARVGAASSPVPSPAAPEAQLKARRLLVGKSGGGGGGPAGPGLFSEDDLAQIKRLYACPELQNKLSPGAPPAGPRELPPASGELGSQLAALPKLLADEQPLAGQQDADKQGQLRKLDAAEQSLEQMIEAMERGNATSEANEHRPVNETIIDDAARRIVDFLLAAEPTTRPPLQQCQTGQSCPAPGANRFQERPMILKLDDFHAQDPELRQANQMKLSLLANNQLDSSYRLLNSNSNLDWTQPQVQPPGDQQQQPQGAQLQRPKSEMMISFEQSAALPPGGNPFDSLVGSQVLKLCSCSCQTMGPRSTAAPGSSRPPGGELPSSLPGPTLSTDAPPPPVTFPPIVYPPATYPPATYPPYLPPVTYPVYPTYPDYPTPRPTFPTDALPSTEPQTFGPPPQTFGPPPTREPPVTTTTQPPPTTTQDYSSEIPALTTATTAPELPATPPTMMTTSATITTTQRTPPGSSSGTQPLAANACDQVEWVRPNKTVYGSARIVWDVDRGNQNYFLCNNLKDGELIPGKTHGFSCKLSSHGKAFEMHNFSVLTKPEHVNLAWVQRNSQAFGKTNFPVVGGYSRQQDPYVVSRCLVKDENNDVITLIGYVNDQGVGWFPFDDIQIECAQYDVLACVG